jgi:hypothetical protein
MNIIELAFDMAKAVESFVEKAKKLFYRAGGYVLTDLISG